MENTKLGDAIKELRKALGNLSQERFAHRLGTTWRTVARWEAAGSLSASNLSRLRSIARAANATEPQRVFENKLREVLKLGEDSPFPLTDRSEPGTPDERELVEEFLQRYREDDPRLKPIIDMLRAFMVERDVEGESEQKRRQEEFWTKLADRRDRSFKSLVGHQKTSKPTTKKTNRPTTKEKKK